MCRSSFVDDHSSHVDAVCLFGFLGGTEFNGYVTLSDSTRTMFRNGNPLPISLSIKQRVTVKLTDIH